MQIHPYLNFNGQCEEAFRFYEQCLGGKIDFMMTYDASPVASHEGWGKKILHASLQIGDQVLQFDMIEGSGNVPAEVPLALVDDPFQIAVPVRAGVERRHARQQSSDNKLPERRIGHIASEPFFLN